jgi:hypothetical protein
VAPDECAWKHQEHVAALEVGQCQTTFDRPDAEYLASMIDKLIGDN